MGWGGWGGMLAFMYSICAHVLDALNLTLLLATMLTFHCALSSQRGPKFLSQIAPASLRALPCFFVGKSTIFEWTFLRFVEHKIQYPLLPLNFQMDPPKIAKSCQIMEIVYPIPFLMFNFHWNSIADPHWNSGGPFRQRGISVEAVLFKAACLKFITVLRNILPVPRRWWNGFKQRRNGRSKSFSFQSGSVVMLMIIWEFIDVYRCLSMFIDVYRCFYRCFYRCL